MSKWKIKIDKYIFSYIALFSMCFYYQLSDTVLYHPAAESFLLLSMFLFMLQFIIADRYRLKTLILISAFLGLFIFQYMLGHDSRILVYIISLLGLKDIPVKKIIKFILYEKIILIGLIVFITSLGIHFITKSNEYTLGFIHGNLFMVNVLEIFLLYICMNWQSMKGYSNIVIAIMIIITFLVSESRTGLLLFALSFILYLQIKYSKEKKLKYLQKIVIIVPSLMFAISIGVPYLINANWVKSYPLLRQFIDKMDTLLSSRLTLSALRLRNTDINLLSSTTNQLRMKMYRYSVVDSGYVQLLLVFGIIGSILFLLFYTRIIYKLCKIDGWGKEKYIYLLSVLTMCLYAFTENSLCSLKYNFTLLFVLLFNEKNLTQYITNVFFRLKNKKIDISPKIRALKE